MNLKNMLIERSQTQRPQRVSFYLHEMFRIGRCGEMTSRLVITYGVGMGFPGISVVKYPPAMQQTQETRVHSLGWKDPLEKEMATHSSILAWENPWTEEPDGLHCPWGHERVRQDLVTEQQH